MFRKAFFVIMGILPIVGYAQCKKYTTYQITTGGKAGTYYQIGLNLAKYVAPDACIDLKVINSNGSLDNVYKLRSPEYPKLKFAIVQNDVLQELEKLASAGDEQAKDLVKNLRVIKALYNEEIHIISKKTSQINNFGDLKGKIISVGPEKSGTAMTSLLLYKGLFGKNLEHYKFQNFDEGISSLESGEVDVIVKVAGQPVSSLSIFPESAADVIKLLSYDERNSAHNAINTYYDAEIIKSSYPWLNQDIQTLSTKSYLITFNYSKEPTKSHIKNFAMSINKHLRTLQENASKNINTPHLKWKEVPIECNTELPGGWKYYSGAIDACINTGEHDSSVVPECTDFRRKLNLCQ